MKIKSFKYTNKRYYYIMICLLVAYDFLMLVQVPSAPINNGMKKFYDFQKFAVAVGDDGGGCSGERVVTVLDVSDGAWNGLGVNIPYEIRGVDRAERLTMKTKHIW